MKDGKGWKILGYVLLGLGAVIGIASSIVSDKQRELTIKNEVSDQIAGLISSLSDGEES